MGNIFSIRGSSDRDETRKRKIDDTDSPTESSAERGVTSDILHTPKRKRIKSTSKYIYQTLFLDGENSDVSICALGKEWKLHKLYLSQSPYFSCMFSGSWKESSLHDIHIDIADPNINEAALKIAFGSLYKDDVFIKPIQVVQVLAAAMLLQLEGLIDQCSSMMRDTISGQTVCKYYTAGCRYALTTITQDCRDWLLTNLLPNETPGLLKGISIEVMADLINSPNLCVMQVEMDVYTLLKKWMFVRLNPSWAGNNKDLITDSDTFFRGTNTTEEDTKSAFLMTDKGQQFLPPFCQIRWQHLLTDLASLKILEKDHIVNMGWLRPGYELHWKEMLKMEQGLELGPEEAPDRTLFDRLSQRCGRVLSKDGEFCWRWVGYSYGVDLLITFVNNIITLKRNTHSQSCPHAVSLQTLRHITYRLRLACFDENGKVKKYKSTSMKHLSLGKDEEVVVMAVDRGFSFPLHITVNLLLTTPPESGEPFITMDYDTVMTNLQQADQREVVHHKSVQTVCNTVEDSCDTGVRTVTRGNRS